MKKTMLKNIFRDIKSSKSRFISLMMITLVGVATFTGVLSVTPMMQTNANRYLNNQNLFDGRIIDPMGISKEQVDQVLNQVDIREWEQSYTLDSMVELGSTQVVARLYSGDDLNQVYIIEGRDINRDDECLVDKGSAWALNQTVTVSQNVAGQIIKKECQVVGIGYFPQSMSRNHRGVSTLGTGRIQMLIHVKTSFVDAFVGHFMKPNTLSFTLNGGQDVSTFSDAYLEKVDTVQQLDTIFSQNAQIETRRTNSSIEAYYQDSSKINEIAAVFPLIFYVVAALVGSTIMSRMIDDQRTQIGLYSALGYDRIQIIFYYMIYASVAVMIGATLGVVIGFNLIPRAVLSAYQAIYQMSVTSIVFVPHVAIIGVGSILLLIVGIACLAAYSSTKETAASLMRPKAPVAGKHIMLEHITFIWKHLSFMNKVSSRNLFRYKKRLFMTLFGIIGCSSLLMTGFGLQTSITPITGRQFDQIMTHQAYAITSPMNDKQMALFNATLKDEPSIDYVAGMFQSVLSVSSHDQLESANIVSTKNIDDMNRMYQFFEQRQPFEMKENDVIISRKLAKLLNIQVGDSIDVDFNQGDQKLVVTGITDMYIGHYVFVGMSNMTIDLPVNQLLIQSSNVEKAVEQLSTKDGVLMVQSMNDVKVIVKDSMKGLNNVVYILIGFAAMLVFIVLFSLTSINLSERRRELATLKVLGFYEGEVASYVFKENMILTIVGALMGLGVGTVMHRFVVTRAEMPELYFIKTQPLMNYLLTFAATVLFSALVSLVMKRFITKIDMVESLKSNE